MSSINVPDVSVNLVPEQSTGDLTRPRTLVVGTIPTAKNAIFGADTSKFLQISQEVSFEQMDDKDLAEMIGTGSLYHRVLMAKRGSAKYVPIDFLLVKNDAATDVSTITFAEDATMKSTIKVTVFHGFYYSATVRATAGMTAADIADAVAEQLSNSINAPFTAASAAGVVTLTWVDGFVTESTPVHVTTIDTAVLPVVAHVTKTAPTQPLADLFDVLGERRYTSISWPEYYFDKIQIPNQFLLDRFNTFNDILDGQVYSTITGSLVSTIEDTATLSGQPVCFSVDKLIDGLYGASIGSSSNTHPDLSWAFLAAAFDRLIVPNADLTDIVSGAQGLSDYIGGKALVSLPYHNTPIPNVLPDNAAWYFTHQEQKQLNDNNLSTVGVNRAGTNNISGNIVTMWKTDAAGNSNNVWTPLEHIRTSSVLREQLVADMRIYFGKTRMTNGDLIFDRSMVNKASVEEFLDLKFKEYGELTWVTAGDDALEKFQKRRFVSLDPSTQTVTITAEYEIVTHVGSVVMTLRTTTKYK